MVVLIRTSPKGPPSALFLFHGNEIIRVTRYLTYEEVEKSDPNLFKKPGGIVFVDTGG